MKRHWHPSPGTELLLHAALDRGPAAAAAWNAWKDSGGDIDTIDHSSFRLLPLIAKNLADHGVPEPSLGRLRGVRRRAWVEHTNLMRRLAPYAAELVSKGLKLIFLKGVVLAPLYYGELGLRSLSDVDVLVRPADVPRAVEILAGRGLKPNGHYPSSLRQALTGEKNLAHEGYRHGLPFVNGDGHEIDLHWSAMCSNVGPHIDDGFWARAVPFSVAGIDGLTLSPGDHLLHVMVHGLSFSDTPTIRWITDAHAILRSTKPEHAIDWKTLLAEVEQRALALPVSEALEYLVDKFGAPIPSWVREQLAKIRPTFLSRLRYSEMLHDWNEVRHPGTTLVGLLRFTEGREPLDALRVSGRYFLHRLDLRSPRYVASQVALSLVGWMPDLPREAFQGWVRKHRK